MSIALPIMIESYSRPQDYVVVQTYRQVLYMRQPVMNVSSQGSCYKTGSKQTK